MTYSTADINEEGTYSEWEKEYYESIEDLAKLEAFEWEVVPDN